MQSDSASEPFQRFAFRVLPSIVARARTLPAGARLTASRAEILAALRSRQFLYPTQVPPLYRSPDRFLGWVGSFFVPVANGPALPPGAADSWYPLPQQDEQAPPDDGVSSAQLFESSSAADIVWEDPQLSNLLADPEARTESAKAPANKSSTPEVSSPKAETDPRRRVANVRLIAVVTPTVEEASEYRAALAASDEKLRAIEQTRGRIRLLREFIEKARAVSSDPSLMPLQQSMSADLASFERRESELAAGLQVALQERADLRSELEDRLHRERVAPLQALGKKPGEVESRDEKKLLL